MDKTKTIECDLSSITKVTPVIIYILKTYDHPFEMAGHAQTKIVGYTFDEKVALEFEKKSCGFTGCSFEIVKKYTPPNKTNRVKYE